MTLLSDFGGFLSGKGRGGGVSVTTNYLATLGATLNAGFTCSSGRKYVAFMDDQGRGIDELRRRYDDSIALGSTTMTVVLYDFQIVTLVPLADVLKDIKELMANLSNAYGYTSYA